MKWFGPASPSVSGGYNWEPMVFKLSCWLKPSNPTIGLGIASGIEAWSVSSVKGCVTAKATGVPTMGEELEGMASATLFSFWSPRDCGPSPRWPETREAASRARMAAPKIRSLSQPSIRGSCDDLDRYSRGLRKKRGDSTTPAARSSWGRQANRSRARSCAFRASSSRLRGGALVATEAMSRCAASVTSSTARLNAASLARDGLFIPLSLRTN